VALADFQFAVEAGTGVAGEQGVAGVETLDREQVPGTVQALDMAGAHGSVPSDLAEGQNLARAPVLGGGEYRDVDLDLGPVGRIRDDPGSHLACRAVALVAVAMAVNQASRRVMEKAGLRLARTFRQPWPHLAGGDQIEVVRYVLNKADWQQDQQP